MQTSENRGEIPRNAGTVIGGRWRIIDCIGDDREGFLYDAVSVDDRDGNKAVWIREAFDPKGGTHFSEEDAYILKEKIRILNEAGEGITPLISFFSENGSFYYVMPSSTAKTVRETVCERKRPETVRTEAEIMNSLIPVLSVLSTLHKKGFIHRGITADSLLVSPDGKLFLRGAGPALSGSEREERSIHLSEVFAASELYDVDQDQGPWTDIYALMASVYYLFTGVQPQATVERVFFDALKSPRETGADISEKGNDLIMKGLALTPENRFQSADEVIAAIRELYPDQNEIRRKKQRRTAAIGLLLTAAIVIGSGCFYHFNRRKLFFHGEDTTVFYLYHEMAEKGADVNDEVIRECIEGIHARINVLTEGEKYLWEQEGERIRVELPSKLIGEGNRRTTLESYVLSPFIGTRTAPYADKPTSFYLDPIPRDALLDYELVDTDTSVFSSDSGLSSEDGMIPKRTLEFSIKPEYAYTFFYCYLDRGNLSIDYAGGFSVLDGLQFVLTEEGRKILLISGPETDALLKVVAYNLMNDPLPGYIRYSFEHKNIKWQDPGKTFLKGNHQIGIRDFPGNKILQFFEVNGYTHSNELTGEEEAQVKRMLDSLSTDYAYGLSADSGEVCFALKADQQLDHPEEATMIQDPINCYKPAKRKPNTIQKINSMGELLEEEKR